MSATYSDAVPWSNKDRVRFLVGDTVVANALLTDEEINNQLAVEQAGGITGSALPYYAAASLLDVLLTRWLSAGKGISEKQVSKLRIIFGLGERGAGGDSLRAIIENLRIEGSRRLQTAPHRFRALRSRKRSASEIANRGL